MSTAIVQRRETAPARVLRDRVVCILQDAERMLQKATTVQQAKLIADVAVAQQVYAKRQQLGQDIEGFAHALKIEALSRLGELLKVLPKADGGDAQRTRFRKGTESPPTLGDYGIGKKESAVAQQLAALPAETRHAIARQEVKLTQVLRQVRHDQAHAQVRQLPKPDGLYDVLVVDPPWQYDRQPTDSGMRGECAYATMSVEQLRALKLPAAPNAVLWLWTTNSFMREAYDLLDEWGFEAKTILTWDKVNLGLGSWLRNVTEHCILAVRGRPVVTLTNQTTLIREARREHSRKPEAFYALVEQLCPGRKFEYFSCTPRPGWFGYGFEADKYAASV